MINSVTLSLYNNICESNQKKSVFLILHFKELEKSVQKDIFVSDYTKDF